MIPAKKNRLVQEWFRGYARSYLRRSFHRILVTGEMPGPLDGPTLVCVNHSSWWDLLLAFWLSRDVLDWDGYGPMDERQLRRYPILTRIGVFGVDRESLQGGREFLEYARRVMAGRKLALWITAQGAMVSNDRRPVRFYSGVAHLAQALGDCRVMTLALDYEFWDEKRPEAFVSFGPVRRIEAGPHFSRRALLQELETGLEGQMDALAALRRQRDPSLFRVVLDGRGGISPVYDAIRRLGALARGKRFSSEHGAVSTPPRWGPARRLE